MNILLEEASKKELLSIAEASALIGFNETRLRHAIKNQEIMFVPGSRGGLHITRESLLRWLRSIEGYYIDKSTPYEGKYK